MNIPSYDIVLLTQKEYVNPSFITPYIQNILTEDQLLTTALEAKGFKVTRTFWDDMQFDWENTRFALFRSTWDYFHRFSEFHPWLIQKSQQIQLINSYPTILWSMDKHYLGDLRDCGVNIPPTVFIEQGSKVSLKDQFDQTGWDKAILKPAIGGAARHAYCLDANNVNAHEAIFQSLLLNETLLLQEFQENILSRGEVSFMVFGGKFSHAVLKKAKPGDFRVQDDFGGTIHPYTASQAEQNFVERAIAQCKEMPVYARVDVMWDNNDQLCLSELELIEPELWFRTDLNAGNAMANAVQQYCRPLLE